jgi:predicted secreted protein
LRERYLDSENVDVIIINEDGTTESGNATISDFSLDVPYDDAVTYSLTLDGSGPLESGAVMEV